jgi:HK97 family phage portal protein
MECRQGMQNRKTFKSDPSTGESDVFFIKMFNPNDYWRGQSPLMAAAVAADTFNAGSSWNYSLLKNSARPSGLLRFKGGYPGQEEIQKLREHFKRAIQGSSNAGEIPMLSDDTEWTAMSQSPRDMDFINTMKESAKYVASALGVPLPLIDNDSATFNNIEQSKERLYTDTVIPDLEEFVNALGIWLLPRFGEGLHFKLDLDSIPALEKMRERAFDRSAKAYTSGILTREESRELIGYEPTAEGEFRPLMVPQSAREATEDKSAEILHKIAYG